MKKRLLVFLILLISASEILFSQDLHYSQFYNSPMNLNPATVGIFNGDKRFNLSFRDQWRFVPVAWTTFSLQYDFKKYLEKEDQFLGFGAILNYDQQGDSKLTLTGLNIAGSYTKILTPKHLLTGGLLIGMNNRAYNTTNLTWDKQWDGVAFNSSILSGEKFDLRRILLFELSAGANYRFQKSERTKLDLGVGAYHLQTPKTSFYNVPVEELPMRLTLSGIGNVQVAKGLDIQLSAMHQIQERYNETILGALAKLYVNQKRGKETQVHAGLGYRTAGSLIPTFALQYNEWYASFSYDIDGNTFNDLSSSNRGGPEFHLRYIIKNVKALNARKNCPIY
jgi:type IX secretion system PorP/SprF family membrane protein